LQAFDINVADFIRYATINFLLSQFCGANMGAVVQFYQRQSRVEEVERALSRLVADFVAKGYHPAQIILDLADIVEQDIMNYPIVELNNN
jgi:hypothetical protein